ncbi:MULTISPECIES: MmcQ/YjbR family DNA-binding protein [Alphaproteobacteria]|uniref:MmcQ/YjbR family DNA-binding protein n=2 Tax=Alphaproteobacteria TaxID=28211 RepID=A0A512HDY9_9HYPH|nr:MULTISPECIES: MmcQ/YjbR family DNA-binding protein [Alphaproteobacteria]GEO83675.1 hypothetical protein RNA01_06070 [Ciceribacter naphthalenivorans]GLR24173.1 hypothetical protein GCM10007920_39670 [Ciceribacter naphthalenivorans]GLT07029.1 hypothetical protein GCM10007926_39670 [Sphingomonas psychrolutea]
MDLFQQVDFDRFVTDLAGVILVDQWESHVAKVGDKVFTLLHRGDEGTNICLKCTEESFEILTALDGIGQARYFAKRKWVSITDKAPLSPDELVHYVKRSYDLVAEGLTRKLRSELGIVPLA